MRTKDKIVLAAIKLFSQYSPPEVSLQKIADQLGIQKSSIYYHFKTKDQIMESAILYIMDKIPLEPPSLETIRIELQSQSPEQILTKYTVYRNDHNDYRDLLRALFRLSFHTGATIRLNNKVLYRFRSVVFRVLKGLNRLGAIPDGDLRTLSTMWAHVTLVYSLFFTHGYQIYNSYYASMSLFIGIAVRGIPAVDAGDVALPVHDFPIPGEPRTTRDTIASCAFHLFCAQGYGKTSMRQIAKRAGIQVGNIYKQYGNKGEIITHIMQSASDLYPKFESVFDLQIAETARRNDPQLLVRAFASCYLPTQGVHAKQHYRLLMLEQYRVEQVRDYYCNTLQNDCLAVERALDSLVALNTIPPCSSSLIARAYLFNHCTLSIQCALLDRDLSKSRKYRLRSAALLTGAILGGAAW